MARLRVKNWAQFQHYKDRAPPWVKLHKGLLDDVEFQRLPVASRALAPMPWLLASESEEGSVDDDVEKLAFRLRQSLEEVRGAVKSLILAGFLIPDSNTLAEGLRDACLETERETEKEAEAEAEKKTSRPRSAGYSDEFESAWRIYPHRPGQSKGEAWRAWCARIKAGCTVEAMTEGAARYAAFCEAEKTEPRFIKHAATFFGADRHFENDWTPTKRKPAAEPVRMPKSFRELEEEAARRRYLEAAGKLPPQGGDVIDAEPTQTLLIGGEQ